MNRRAYRRRGITLLFVISLIVLFLLMGATFVAISGNFLRTSRTRANLEVRGDSAKSMIDRAFMDLVRGTKSTTSALNHPTLGDQSILGDMFGNGTGLKGTVDGLIPPTTEANGQLIRLTLTVTTPPTDLTLLDKVGAFGGQVLTFVSNTPTAIVKGTSCRIFHYDVQYDGTGAVSSRSFLIVPEWTNGLNPFANPLDLVGAAVLVNGRAFDGDGTAVKPNETYDALDAQTAFLFGVDFDSIPWVYSSFFHFGNATYEGFRPTPFQAMPLADNDGDGRPDLELDNDGDGFNDSIWMDVGNPVQTDSSGRQYKALVGYMVLDLDGRFNLNVHGNGDDAQGRRVTSNRALLDNPTFVSRGQGYGPSEISLGRLFLRPPLVFPYDFLAGNFSQEYFNILGDPSVPFFGRNGNDLDQFGASTGAYTPGLSIFQDQWSQYKLFGYPLSGLGNLYGSRMDLFGHFGWGFPSRDPLVLLPNGMPQVDAVPLAEDLIDNPFETDFAGYPSAGPSENPLVLSGSTRSDHLFSAKELERIYRAHDMDSKFLANRLLTLAPTTLGDPANRLRVSTESWEVPVPPANSVAELATIMQISAPTRMSEIATMLSPDILLGLKMDINRAFGNGIDDNGFGSIDAYFADGLGDSNQITYPDGSNLELDISRNGQGTADNLVLAREEFAKQLYILALLKLLPAAPQPPGGDFDGDGFDIGNDPDDLLTLAQWCINVVDFRDPDAIMTPFEFDTNPFNGWECDGVLTADPMTGTYLPDGSETQVVWGCERPELLITETLASHDRRTEDTSEGGTFASGGDPLHFDNRLRPEASAFIELYAPWVAGNDVTYPAELYQGGDVELSRTHNYPLTNGDPVWRIAIAGSGPNGSEYINEPIPTPSNPVSIDNRNRDPDVESINAATIDRVVYFIQYPGAPFIGSGTAEAFYATRSDQLFLPVGEFAVLGSTGNSPPNTTSSTTLFTTTFGRRSTTAGPGDTRSIIFDTQIPNPQVQVTDFSISTGDMVTLTRNALPIPIEFPRSNPGDPPRPFNVSDPTGGYPILDFVGVPATQTVDGWIYNTPYHVPLDLGTKDPISYDFRCIGDNKTTPTYCVAHLQRLANPLAPWNVITNPYRTVDSLSMNLTAFNGISETPDQTISGPSADPFETVRDFASMERGRNRKYPPSNSFDAVATDINEHRNLWSQDGLKTAFEDRRGNLYRFPGPGLNEINRAGDVSWRLSHEPATNIADLDQHIFNSTIFETLGTFNDSWFDHWQGDVTELPSTPPKPNWSFNNNTPTNEPSRYAYIVPPLPEPYPIPPPLGLDGFKPFTWLTWNNRPYVSQYELMLVPTKSSSRLLQSYSAQAADDPFGDIATGYVGNGFNHLPNFFYSELIFDPDGPGGPIPPSTRLGNLNKLLDFVEVPSRYVGTERYFNENPASAMPIFGLAPPFNMVSRFRYPGKANINTILDRDFWTAVMGDYAEALPPGGPNMDYAVMNASRRDPMTFEEFSRPFRDTIDPAVSVNGGLLRKGTGADALFNFDTVNQLPHNNSDRNAYFRYDAIQRLGNLVTTRSSVFAIWITVGYFEVDPATGELRTNQPTTCELGSDSGQVKRHRGFFIFDRSIPVGFEQGIDHNIDRAIMVQSYIE